MIEKNFKFNFTVNIIDGAVFGLAMGFVSYTTVLPLFVRQLSGSALLIGLITATHLVGWQVPQLFTARMVSRQKRYLPLALVMTIQERFPYLVLAIVTWFSPAIGAPATLILAFFLLMWQGIGGGLTANPWQNLMAKVIIPERIGIFYGIQAALFNSFFAIGAVTSGFILERLSFPQNFALCFTAAGISTLLSMICLALTREPEHQIPSEPIQAGAHWKNVRSILTEDHNFRNFVVVRILFQFATMAFTFYTVYAVERFGMSKILAGQVTGAVAVLTVAANPALGWLGDRLGHRRVLLAGSLAAALSTVLAVLVPSLGWFLIVFILTAIPGVVAYTSIMSMTLEFGNGADRPIYIGLANTLVAPAALLAPMIGGWLVDNTNPNLFRGIYHLESGVFNSGYSAAFAFSAIFAVLAVFFSTRLKNPRSIRYNSRSQKDTK